MRTTIDIDDELMATALRETGLSGKQAVIEEGLRALIQRHRAKELLAAFGRYSWDGDHSERRRSWRCR
jgi:Arc/MetJ family transcription regulator